MFGDAGATTTGSLGAGSSDASETESVEYPVSRADVSSSPKVDIEGLDRPASAAPVATSSSAGELARIMAAESGAPGWLSADAKLVSGSSTASKGLGDLSGPDTGVGNVVGVGEAP